MKKQAFLGMDVSKGYCDFVLQDQLGGNLVGVTKIYDTKKGHKKLCKYLENWKKEFEIEEFVIGVESTGGYENNWYNMLKVRSSDELRVKRINPRFIHFEAQTEGRKSVDDGVSASVIAGYLRKNYHQINFNEWERSDEMESARKVFKYIQRLVKQSTITKNVLDKLMYVYLPEILSFKGEKYADWFLEVLKKYPSRKAILKAGARKLSKIRYLSKKRAEEIIEALKDSVGKEGDFLIELSISEQAEDIQILSKKIKRLRKQLEIAVREEMGKEVEIVESISGVGPDTAVPIVLEVGKHSRFNKAASLVSFWGVNPTVKQSGDKKYTAGMSKNGNPAIRGVLYLAARNVTIHEPYFKKKYRALRVKGKSDKEALCIVMAKLIRIIYGMLKNGTTFEPKIDEANSAKRTKASDGKSSKRKESLSEVGLAPISRRKRRKLKQAEKEKAEVAQVGA